MVLGTVLSLKSSAQLSASFTANNTSGCSPLLVNFTDHSTGNPTDWKWNLGNGASSVLQNPSVVYINPGTYTVKLVIKNTAGADSITKVQYITVYAKPQVSFSASNYSGCVPSTITFTDLSNPVNGAITNRRWDFGDGTFSTDANPTHTYTSAGNFNVSLMVTNSFGCSESLTRLSFINIQEKPNANFNNGATNSCTVPFRVNFTNLSDTSISLVRTNTLPYTYFWNFGDSSTSTLTNPTHFYTSPGVYTVTLIVTNSFGCSDTMIKTNLINIGNLVDSFFMPDTVCVNTPVHITNYSSTTQCVWNFGDGTTSLLFSPVKTFTTAGTFIVKLLNTLGSCNDSISKPITVLPPPVVDFRGDHLNSCKAPFTVNFTNLSSNTDSYSWNFGDSSTSNAFSPTHTYNNEGLFSVTLTAQSVYGCSSSLTKSDYIKISFPVASILNMPQRGCAPLLCDFTPSVVTSDSIASYFWEFGDGSTSSLMNPSHTYDAGVYDVRLIITTVKGCTDTVVYIGGVKAGVKPHPNFSASPTNACAITPVVFTNLTPASDSVDQWMWTFGDGTSSTQENPQHLYIDTGYMTVQLIAYNRGCPDTFRIVDLLNVNSPIAKFTVIKSCTNRLVKTFTNMSIASDSYVWDFGDGRTSTETSPVHTYDSSGIYTVTLTAYNNISGCNYVKTSTVYVIDQHPNFVATDTNLCKGNSTTFTVTGVNSTYFNSYSWNFGDNITGTGSPITKIYYNPGMYNIRLFSIDKNSCKDTLTKNKYIVVNGPTAYFNSVSTDACANSTIAFTDSSVSDGRNQIQQWIWNYGDGRIDTLTHGNTTHVYTNTGIFNVSLTVIDGKGCTHKVTKYNFVNISKPTALFSTIDTTGCPYSIIHFTGNAIGSNLTYNWDFGDGSSSTQQNPTHQFANNGRYDIRLIVTSAIGCKDTLVKSRLVNVINPTASFTVSDSVGTCPPLIVYFTNTSTNYVSQLWEFGDGTSTTTDNPSHFYSYSGVFYAKLTVTSIGGCRATYIKKIVVHGPRGTIAYGGLSGCTPLTVNFFATTQGTNSIVWDFSDGNTSITTDTSIAHTYTIAGSYLPRVILRDTAGCTISITGIDTIKVYDLNASFNISNRNICDAGIVNFTNNIATNDIISSLKWNFGDGTSSNLNNPSHNYNANGNYTPSMIVSTVHGCIDTIVSNLPIKIMPTPQAVISQTANGCAGVSITFKGLLTNNDTSNLSWNWIFGNGNNSNIKNPTPQTYNTAGLYPIRLIVTNPFGCADTVNTTAEAYPYPNVNASIDTFVCKGRGVNLNVTGANTYVWSPSTGLNCTTCSTPKANPDSAIRYYVTGKTIHGCSAIDSVNVIVKYPFNMTASKGDTLCTGSSRRLFATGAERYSWTPTLGLDNPSSASPVATPSTTTYYQVIGYDEKHCFADTSIVPIIVFGIPFVEAGPDRVINVGQSIELIPTISSDVIEAKWSPTGSLTRSSFPGVIVKPRSTTTYKVDVKNAGGCTATDELTVNVLCNGANLFIPNTFSPNGDGANDIFYPRGSGIFSIKSIKVFSRWGEVIYQKNNIKANDPSTGWDGKFKGAQLNPDVYVYIVEVSCDNNTILTFKGNVALIK